MNRRDEVRVLREMRDLRRFGMLKPGELYRVKQVLRHAGGRIPAAHAVIPQPFAEAFDGSRIIRALDEVSDDDLDRLRRAWRGTYSCNEGTMRTDFSGLGAKLEARLVHALYLAQRWKVVSFSFTLDIAQGFDAELAFENAPTWRMHAEDFSYLEDAVLKQLIEYVYEHRLARIHDPDAGLIDSIRQLSAQDIEELQRAGEENGMTDMFREIVHMSQPLPHSRSYSLTWLMAVGTCAFGALGFLFAMVLTLRAPGMYWNAITLGVVAVVLMGVGAALALSNVHSPVWSWFARQAERNVHPDEDFGPFQGLEDPAFLEYLGTGTFVGHDRVQIDAVTDILCKPPSATWLFFTTANGFLARASDGIPRTPLQALTDGDFELVLRLARGEAER